MDMTGRRDDGGEKLLHNALVNILHIGLHLKNAPYHGKYELNMGRKLSG